MKIILQIFLSFFFFWSFLSEALPTRVVKNQTCMTSNCHNEIQKRAYLHGPIKAEGCTVCHEVKRESAKHPELVQIPKEEVNKSCFMCHDEMKNQLAFSKHSHGAIGKQTCIGCHDPHSSDHKRLVKWPANQELCLKCHEEKNPKHKHHNLSEMKSGCLSCHSPHSSENNKLLVIDTAGALCLKCHQLGPHFLGQVKHKPFADGECLKCHKVHGTETSFLLDKKYTQETYQKFSEESVELCLSCHKSDLLSNSMATKFRNGNNNLHHLHIRGQKKERTCTACHEVHTSANASLIKNQFDYKGQKLPIVFEKKTNGGTCATACHKKMEYNFNEAVKNVSDR